MTTADHSGRAAVVTDRDALLSDYRWVIEVNLRSAITATEVFLGGWSDSLRQEVLPDVRVEQLYDTSSPAAEDIAQIIAFTLSRPRHVAVNEILVRPAGQA